MKKTLLFSSLVVGLALVGCSKSARTSSTTASNDNPPPPAPASNSADAMARDAGNAVRSAANTVASSAREMEWKLTNNDIKDDVAAGRTIERTKAGAPTGATPDKSNLKNAVETRLRADSQIGSAPIDVDADRDGQINLSGKANTVDQIGHAIALALDTDGVTKVSSKIKVDKEGNAHR
jgi:hypothetical protein